MKLFKCRKRQKSMCKVRIKMKVKETKMVKRMISLTYWIRWFKISKKNLIWKRKKTRGLVLSIKSIRQVLWRWSIAKTQSVNLAKNTNKSNRKRTSPSRSKTKTKTHPQSQILSIPVKILSNKKISAVAPKHKEISTPKSSRSTKSTDLTSNSIHKSMFSTKLSKTPPAISDRRCKETTPVYSRSSSRV